MILGQLSANLLREEVPRAADCMTPHDERHFRLDLDVCSYIGIGRFVLGLYDDIEVLGNDEFKEYLRQHIERMYSKSH